MRSSIVTGVLLAIGAAVAFGVTTPVIAWASHEVGPLTTAALLYAGAALAAFAMRIRGRNSGGPLRRSDVPRIVAIAVVGAAIAPTCLAWGLARAGATAGSLVLNLEAVFTVALAWLVFREPLGRRVLVAVAIMAVAGGLLALDASSRSQTGLLGALVVVTATLAWAPGERPRRTADIRPSLATLLKSDFCNALNSFAARIAASGWTSRRDPARVPRKRYSFSPA